MASEEEEKQRQRDAAGRWLREKWPNPQCPMCFARNWHVAPTAELRDFTGGDLVLGGPIIPVVPVVCTNCGNTVLVNALIAGAVEQPPQASSDTPTDVAEEDQ